MKEHLLTIDNQRLGSERRAVDDIKLFSKNANFSIEQVMQMLNISPEDQTLFTKLINNPEFYDEYFYPETYYKVVEVEE